MPLIGIHNVADFYSPHYLDELLVGDLKGIFQGWSEKKDPPPARLARLAAAFFQAKAMAAERGDPEERFQLAHGFHVALVEALGYQPLSGGLALLEKGEALPILAEVRREGQAHLWVCEAPWCSGEDSPPGACPHPLPG
jgi:hypothetical protein